MSKVKKAETEYEDAVRQTHHIEHEKQEFDGARSGPQGEDPTSKKESSMPKNRSDGPIKIWIRPG